MDLEINQGATFKEYYWFCYPLPAVVASPVSPMERGALTATLDNVTGLAVYDHMVVDGYAYMIADIDGNELTFDTELLDTYTIDQELQFFRAYNLTGSTIEGQVRDAETREELAEFDVVKRADFGIELGFDYDVFEGLEIGYNSALEAVYDLEALNGTVKDRLMGGIAKITNEVTV